MNQHLVIMVHALVLVLMIHLPGHPAVCHVVEVEQDQEMSLLQEMLILEEVVIFPVVQPGVIGFPVLVLKNGLLGHPAMCLVELEQDQEM